MEKELSLVVDSGGNALKLTLVANTSQATALIYQNTVVIHSTVDCFVRRGATPVALGTGVDLFIPANTSLRLSGLDPAGDKLAVIAAAVGTVYISPGA